MLGGFPVVEISHNDYKAGCRTGKKVRKYIQISDMLQAEKRERVPVCSTELTACSVQELALERLNAVLSSETIDNGCIFMSDPRGKIHDFNILGMDDFAYDFSKANYIYHLDNDQKQGSEYNEFRNKFLIVHINIPEHNIEFEFYLKAFMFPNQTSENYPDPTWRAGSLVVHTPTVSKGWFHQIRWRMAFS